MRTDVNPIYGIVGHVPDPESQDFKDVMAWLGAKGAGTYRIAWLPAGGANASFVPPQLVLNFSVRPEYDMAGYMVLNSPSSILTALGVFNHNNEEYAPPKPAEQPAPSGPRPDTDAPIGALSHTDANGKKHYFGGNTALNAPNFLTAPDGATVKKLVIPFIGGTTRIEWIEV